MDKYDETDVMDDLMSDAAEGPARMDLSDEGDEYDEGDSGDEGDEGDDEFIGRLLGGAARVVGGLIGGGDGADEGDEWDEGDEADEVDEGDTYDEAVDEGNVDSLDDAVADALGADDSDEFLRRLRRVARTVGRGVGRVARVVGPIASAIPLPQAQLIGRVANVAGRLLADGADEFEAIDELVDGLDEDEIDAAAPVLAGLALRRIVPVVARLPRAPRRQLVRNVAAATRTAVRTAGPRAARVVPRVLRTVQRSAHRRRLPQRRVGQTVRRVTSRLVHRPQARRRLARPLVPTQRRATPRGAGAAIARRAVAPISGRVGPMGRAGGGAHYCANCGRRHIRIRGPVTISIQGR